LSEAVLNAASVIDPLLSSRVLRETEIPSLSRSPEVIRYENVVLVVPLPDKYVRCLLLKPWIGIRGDPVTVTFSLQFTVAVIVSPAPYIESLPGVEVILMLEIDGAVESTVWLVSEIEAALELFVARDHTRKSYVPELNPVIVADGVDAFGEVNLWVVAPLQPEVAESLYCTAYSVAAPTAPMLSRTDPSPRFVLVRVAGAVIDGAAIFPQI
jgi:hypothetical protein